MDFVVGVEAFRWDSSADEGPSREQSMVSAQGNVPAKTNHHPVQANNQGIQTKSRNDSNRQSNMTIPFQNAHQNNETETDQYKRLSGKRRRNSRNKGKTSIVAGG
jgi:hypothetical protein